MKGVCITAYKFFEEGRQDRRTGTGTKTMYTFFFKSGYNNSSKPGMHTKHVHRYFQYGLGSLYTNWGYTLVIHTMGDFHKQIGETNIWVD